MTIAETTVPRAATAAAYHARILGFRAQDWMPRPDQATLFQRQEWLAPFYEAVAAHQTDATPLVVEVTDATGTLAYRLPLLHQGRRIVFADLNMTDFNAPLLGPAAPRTRTAAAHALKALRAALPPHDLLHLAKMPGEIGGQINPLLLARPAMLSAVNGNLLLMNDGWDDFHFGLEKTVRKELERSWRVFSRDADTSLHFVTDADEAIAVLETMETIQQTRMAEVGQPYTLDEPVTADFYRRLLRSGIGSGFACLSLLKSGDEIVAALLGVRDRQTYVMIRLVHAAGNWSKVSPGRLLIHKTLEKLHGDGWRRFDFSVGNYAYKRRFGPTRTPLHDLALVGSPRGMAASLRIRAGAFLRRYPKARETVRRLLGKPPSREEN